MFPSTERAEHLGVFCEQAHEKARTKRAIFGQT